MLQKKGWGAGLSGASCSLYLGNGGTWNRFIAVIPRLRRVAWTLRQDTSSQVILLAVCYFAVAELGLTFAIPPGNATAVWPASGLALAAILLLGYRAIWGIWIGAFAVNVLTGVSFPTGIAIATGNSLEALLGAWMFRKCIDPEFPFERTADAFRFAGIVGLSAIIAATFGPASLLMHGYLSPSGFMENWGTWWLGDVSGMIVITPLILSSVRQIRHPIGGFIWSTVIPVLATLLLISQIILGGWIPERTTQYLLYLPVIFLIWVALKLQLCEITVSTAVFSAAAIWGASRGVGTYGSELLSHSLFELQLFIAFYGLTGLALAGMVARRRKAMNELNELKFALDNSAIVVSVDTVGMIRYVNDRFCQISKYPREELIGRECRLTQSCFQPKDGFDDLWQTIRDGRIWEGEVHNLARDDSGYWLFATVIPIFDGRVHPHHYLFICFDITDRKAASGQIQRLSQAVQKTTDIIFVTDLDGKIEYVNPAFEVSTGYSLKEAIGQTPRILNSGLQDKQYYEKLWSSILAGNVYRATTVNRKKSGKLFQAEQTITPIKDDDGNITHFVSVLKDITELLKRKEEEVAMRLAREVQQRYYCATASIDGFDIAGAAYTAEETGGDYFDFIHMPGGCLGIVIGDVSGHGISAALVMAETRAYIRSYSADCTDAGDILTRVNRALFNDLTADRFVTLLLACLDPHMRTITYANAGHESGYILSLEGEITKSMKSIGPPVGVLPNLEYRSSRPILLTPGQTMILLTDGITEALDDDGRQFGAQRAVRYVREHEPESSHEITRGLYRTVKSYSTNGRLEDDVTSVILKVR